MKRWSFFVATVLAGGLSMACSDSDEDDDDTETGELNPSLSFFVTSQGSGANGGNLGGLAGADAMCESLAAAVGAGSREWRAYLSTDTVDAISRIGDGPWYNQALEEVASDVADLMTNGISNGNPQLIVDETGTAAPGMQHDILTGSLADGTKAMGLNCANWTSSDAALAEQPQVGHSDIPPAQFSPSWNAAHVSANCSQAGLTMRGGAGRLYCFAAD
jgi:hypothetical protein